MVLSVFRADYKHIHIRYAVYEVVIMRYLVKFEGDIGDPDYNGGMKYFPDLSFPTLEDALKWIEKDVFSEFDPEDDRITIWEITDSDHYKIVWHCSGWHWSFSYNGVTENLDQGCLLNHNRSMYEEACDDI